MDQLARDDIAAAAAAHQELGRDYDGAVAEGLIERIGDEIDKRVDARLRQHSDPPAYRTGLPAPSADPPAEHAGLPAERAGSGQVHHGARPAAWEAIFLGLGSMTIGGLISAALLNQHHSGGSALVALIWLIIGIINVAYARRR